MEQTGNQTLDRSRDSVTEQFTRRGEALAGARAMIPVAATILPVAGVFGAVGMASDLTPFGVFAMSALVCAGASQLAALTLLGGGAALPVIWLTVGVINLRFLLYSASLGLHMKKLSRGWQLLLGVFVVEATYLLGMQRYEQDDSSPYKHWYYLGAALLMYVTWLIATWLGMLLGERLTNPAELGLDFVVIFVFVGFLAPALRNRPAILTAVAAGVIALVLEPLPSRLGLIIAIIGGITMGVVVENRMQNTAENLKETETSGE